MKDVRKHVEIVDKMEVFNIYKYKKFKITTVEEPAFTDVIYCAKTFHIRPQKSTAEI